MGVFFWFLKNAVYHLQMSGCLYFSHHYFLKLYKISGIECLGFDICSV